MRGNEAVPEEIARLSEQPRVTVRRGGAPRRNGECVVYWMQRAMRIWDNPALDAAIAAGNHLGLPVVVYFSVIPNYPHANLRHYHFMQQGLRDAAADAAERGVGFVLRRAPGNRLEKLLEEVRAAMVVGDENPLREPERWRQALAKKLRIPYWTVDADVVVPSKVFGRTYFLLHHFRPHLERELPGFLVEPGNLRPASAWKQKVDSWPVERDITEGFAKLDRSVGPVESFTGGAHAAMKRLRQFVDGELAEYEKTRNKPEVKGTSRLSPYLHFGNISPVRIALEVKRAVEQGKARKSAADSYLNEMIGWRELSVLFVRHNEHYDSWECAEPWARRTLEEHAGDLRPRRYSLAKLEQGHTYDELWNAAQMEMVRHGWMHNYMRMYWAKKILEWTPNPATAFDWAVVLNDKYELDGRDPNGYAGIAWAMVGKHDRPWFDRPIFGTVRYMSGASTGKKFDSAAYVRQNAGG
ncbi:deoxyribodipyrimidine photo-lyase [Occallatibacter riparius]|uniref:Deoxyribodipyrimidine photo-lyase n=1 Tax=Occallatibacter riparius TaxID=1002689 RepID=A0A9J7BU97_9BACT|nr:deoxyribodipyrimidine photo-lyase [Occallatibacter riparius]UWZ86216.1 deoxyribodipyrimidine photo-lyase [Occallatibacter riparius]